MKLPKRLQQLIDDLIQSGLAKDEDEAIKQLNKRGITFGSDFEMRAASDPDKQLMVISKQSRPGKTPPKADVYPSKLNKLIDDRIRLGLAQDEDEAIRQLRDEGYIFGKGFVMKGESKPTENLPSTGDSEYVYSGPRRPPESQLPAKSKKPEPVDAEFEVNESGLVPVSPRYGKVDESPRYATKDIQEKVRGKESKYSIPAIVAGITGVGALGAGAKYVYDKTKGPVRPPEDEQDSAKEAPKPQAEQPKTSKLDSLKEEIKVSPEIRETFGYNPKLENPAEYQKRVEELKESIKTIDFDIPEKEAKSFNDRRDKIAENINKIHQELKADLAEARSEKERREAAVRWGQIIETIGHALVKMSAAIHGLKTGMDLSSGLKFDKHDWNAEFDRILKDIEARRAEAKAEANMKIQEQERQAAGLEKEEATARRAAERAGERQYDLAAQRLVKAEGEIADITQRNVQAINRSKEFNAEQARRNYELSRELDSKLNIKKLEQAAKQAAAAGKPDRQYEQKLKLYGDMQGALASLIEKDKPEARKQFTDAAVQLGMPLEEVDTIIQKATGWSIPIIGRGDKEGAKRLAEAYKPQNTRQSPSYQLQSGLVRVTNGKEILEIPEEDVPAAEADGYRRM